MQRGFNLLAINIIKQALWDLDNNEDRNRIPAEEFFKSKWFDSVCELAEIDRDMVIELIDKKRRRNEIRY